MTSCFPMVAGQNYASGKVCVELLNGGSADTAKITYDTSGTNYCLTEVQAYLGDNIPTNTANNPAVGNFPAKSGQISTKTCVTTYTVQMPLAPDCESGSEFMGRPYKLAAHASVQFANGSGGQTAWSTGVGK